MEPIDTQNYIPQIEVDENYPIIDETIRFIIIVEDDLVEKIDFAL